MEIIKTTKKSTPPIVPAIKPTLVFFPKFGGLKSGQNKATLSDVRTLYSL
ncbi:hypothetical protein HanXRQr2_Chr15g0671421 [Helianthus annuus]|uniref:Uncharacterized protein n=1 Tax=Helianthus annuus TaxID=4232 RepID=A0A9K3DYH9_HELAN|nr:hypothetical protein HanXRQr2_Chr15g0671421 [Helianthus annuus]